MANAVITVASTVLCTELHARFTFKKGRSAGWCEYWQSGGSAIAAYLTTCVAMFALHVLQSSPGVLTEQIVCLGASALAGTGRSCSCASSSSPPTASGPRRRHSG